MESLLIVGTIAVGFIGLYFLLRTRLNQLIIDLYERNQDLQEKGKAEVHSGVKDLLSNSSEKMETVTKQLKEQLKDSQKEIQSLQKQNAEIKQQLKEASKSREKLQASTEDLKKVLSNNQLRGEWGEEIAEDLLENAGFVENVNYLKQESTKQGRPDFTILLPDETKINIDAKFPLDDLLKYQQADKDDEKQRHLENFEKAVKKQVRQVGTKDYIDPSSNTVDFAIMFVPNEMIFSFIYDRLPGVITKSRESKVILSGPFGFTAMLRLIYQAHRNFQYEQNIQETLGLIDEFQKEYDKFGDKLDKIGRGLDSAQKAFREAEGVRHRRLTGVMDKIKEQSSAQALLDEVDTEGDL